MGELTVPEIPGTRAAVTIAIRPEHISPASDRTSQQNTVRAKIATCSYVGSETHYTLDAHGTRLLMHARNVRPGAEVHLVGEEIAIAIPAESVRVLED